MSCTTLKSQVHVVLFLSLMTGLVVSGFAQSSEIDRLKAELKSVTSDSLKLELQVELTERYVGTNAEVCIEEAQKALVLAYKRDELWLVPYLNDYIGMSYDDLGLYEEALAAYAEAISLTREMMLEDTAFFKEYQRDLVVFLNNAGYTEYNRGNSPKAMNFFMESLDMAEQCESPDISATYGSIAEVYFEMGDIANARRYALEAQRSASDSLTQAVDASLLGNIYLEENKLDSAIMVFESLMDNDSLSTNYYMSIAKAGISRVRLKQGRPEQARNEARESLRYALDLDNMVHRADALAIIAEAEVALGNTQTGLSTIDEAIALALETRSLVHLADYFELQGQLRFATGDHAGAYQSEQRSAGLRDSLQMSFNASQYAEMMAARDAAQIRRDADSLRDELRQGRTSERNSRRFAIAMLVCALVLAWIAYLAIKRNERPVFAGSPAVVKVTGADKMQFFERISLTTVVLLLPMVLYNVIWRDIIDFLFSLLGVVIALVIWSVVRFLKFNPIFFVILLVYPMVVLVPNVDQGIHTSMLWIPAVFVVLSYSTDSLKLQVLNGFMSFVAFIGYLFRISISEAGSSLVQPEAEVIMGIIALGAVYLALYYHRGQIFDYRYGLNNTSSFLRLMADSNPNFVFAKDMERRYTFANKAMTDTYGLSLSEIIGHRPEEINEAFKSSEHFKKDDLEVLDAGVDKFIPEEMVLTGDGQAKWLQTLKRPIRDDNGNVVGIIGVATDITAMRNSQMELSKSLSLQEATLNSTADGLLVVDQNNDIVLYNQKFVEIWGEDAIAGPEQGEMRMRKASEKLKDPRQFVSRVEEIFKNPMVKTLDTLEFIDGRIVERYSQAQTIGEEVVGRVWSFRDVTSRETALRDLRNSDLRYKTSLEDNLFAIIRVRDGRFLSINQAFSDLVGYTYEEMENRTLQDVLHPEDMRRFGDFAEQIRTGVQQSGNVSCRIVRKDGTIRYLLASVKGFYDESGEYLESTVIAADISQLKEFENALANSEERYRSLVEASPDGILLTDPSGRITYASQRFVEMTGFGGEHSAIGRSLLEFAEPEESARATGDLQKALNSSAPAFGRYWVRIANGDRMRVELGTRLIKDSEGVATGFILVVRDITAKHRAEIVLRESEARYRVLFENTFDGFMIIGLNGTIEDVNKSAMELLRYPDLGTIKGLSISNIFPSIVEQKPYLDMLSGDIQRSLPMRIEGKDFFSEVFYGEINLSRAPTSDGERIVCAIRDVAERVVLETKERELKNQEVELDALNRELASYSLFNSQKIKLLGEIQEDIDDARKNSNEAVQQILSRVKRKISANLNEQEDMMAFKIQFEKIHPNFFRRLGEISAKLTAHDLKYCAYIRLNMSTQDISNLLYVEKKSVEMSKYRIKKKLGLKTNERLSEFLRAI